MVYFAACRRVFNVAAMSVSNLIHRHALQVDGLDSFGRTALDTARLKSQPALSSLLLAAQVACT